MGHRRLIGVKWAFFFSLFFTPIIGWLIVRNSPKWDVHHDIEIRRSTKQEIQIGWVAIILCIILTILFIRDSKNLEWFSFENIIKFGFCLGLLGGALYLFSKKRYIKIGDELIDNSNARPEIKLSYKDWIMIVCSVGLLVLMSILIVQKFM